MADVDIDVQGMVDAAASASRSALEANNNVQSAFQTLNSMKESWYGATYDVFIGNVNQLKSVFDRAFEISVNKVPQELIAKARSYAAGLEQGQDVSAPGLEAYVAITEIDPSNQFPKGRFREGDVDSAKQQVTSVLDSAIQSMETAGSTIEGIDWSSVAADGNKEEFKRSMNAIKQAIDTVKSALNDAIEAQKATIAALEGAAQAVEAGKDFVESISEQAVQAVTNFTNNVASTASSVWNSLLGKD